MLECNIVSGSDKGEQCWEVYQNNLNRYLLVHFSRVQVFSEILLGLGNVYACLKLF